MTDRILNEAAHNVDFFYLSEHSVSQALLSEVKDLTKKFSLPEEEKLSISMINSPHFRGYNRAGNEMTNGKSDWREQFDIGAEREPYNLTDKDPIWMVLNDYMNWKESIGGVNSAKNIIDSIIFSY